MFYQNIVALASLIKESNIKFSVQVNFAWYLWGVELQARARPPCSITAPQHVHLPPDLRQTVVDAAAWQSCQALPVKLIC